MLSLRAPESSLPSPPSKSVLALDMGNHTLGTRRGLSALLEATLGSKGMGGSSAG